MSLKELILEEEPELDISYVPTTSSEEVQLDPELPTEFVEQVEIDELCISATALESIGVHIACEGMDLSTARDLEKIAPGFIRQAGGSNVFTNRPSLEGLADAAKTVKNKFVEILRKLRDIIVKAYQQFVSWLKAKLSNPENVQIKQEVEEFLAARRTRDSISYISSLPEDAAEAADEVARFMNGDTKAFASQFTDQLQGLVKRVENVEKMMLDNPVQFRVARGAVTVGDLFRVEADAAINGVLNKAMKVANQAMAARNSEKFMEALNAVATTSAELDEFEKNTLINDHPSEHLDDDKAVPFDKLYDNVRTAVKDMARVDITSAANTLLATAGAIIDLSQSVKIEDVMEMIPEDVPAEHHNAYGQQIASLYRRIAKIGSDVLRLWRVRYNSVAAINKLMLAMIELVDGFEKAVVDSSSSLSVEQKTQLAKALAGKGLKIVY